ncbi:Oidioi.mRNA.OKI2018_I69.chr1.g221.t1.cds [Oikopleura dioica]|uniref:Oidioi.mRNA.OKI2018_I69.chr1.g221.t1.cds n=1 Tax=Oikopleura dioica TaxID=34765 RepID=A0ABN7SND8_OIKDI|nr:Oidioi.mRNA.OKI2018_I69.chr1.g221.t1.cds [Oikopleura dioica]
MIRCLFILTNTLAFLGGTALIGLCTWIILDAESIGIEADFIVDFINGFLKEVAENLGELYEEHVGNPEIFEDIFEWISYATYVALAAGCLVTLISFTGCFGAQAKSRCLLTIFEIFMALLIVIQLTGAVLAIFYYPKVDEFLVERFAEYEPIPNPEDINDVNQIPDPDVIFNSQFVDIMQTSLDCCGWNSKDDFPNELPESCFQTDAQNLTSVWENSCGRISIRIFRPKKWPPFLCAHMKEPSILKSQNNETEKYFFVLADDNEKPRLSYVISTTGAFKEDRVIQTPETVSSWGFLGRAGSAMVNGKMHIFGGTADTRKIGILDGCEIRRLRYRLINEYTTSSSIVSVPTLQGSNALLCFDFKQTGKECEEFNGEISLRTIPSEVTHLGACLAIFKGQPTAVSSYEPDGWKTVETRGQDGWSFLSEHPRKLKYHTCLGLADGLMTIGGEDFDGFQRINDIWLLRDSDWNLVGTLKQVPYFFFLFLTEFLFKQAWYASSFLISGEIFAISGDYPYAIEKIEWDGTSVVSSEIINNHPAYYAKPIVFETDAEFCK